MHLLRLTIFVCLLAATSPLAAAEVAVSLISGTPFFAGDPVNGDVYPLAASGDGRFLLVETSANNLAPGIVDINRERDLYVVDRDSGEYDLISHATSSVQRSGDGASTGGFISGDGRWVAFHSRARNLIGDAIYPAPPEDLQIFLFDRSNRTTRLVSHTPGSATTAADRQAKLVGLSDDGRWVAFHSDAANLLPGEGSGLQIYLYDRATGQSQLASHRAGEPGTAAIGHSRGVRLSSNGRFLLFESTAADLVAGQIDGNAADDVFVYDRQKESSELLSGDAANPLAAVGGKARDLTPDGRYVALESHGVRLATGLADGNGEADADCFLADRQTGTVRLVSRSAANPAQSGGDASTCHHLSQDGRFVFFSSTAADLVAPFGDNSFLYDAYYFDGQTGTVTLASHRAGDPAQSGDNYSFFSDLPQALSADGRFAILVSAATDLEAGVADTNDSQDFYLFDRIAGSSTLVSRFGTSQVAGSVLPEHGLIASDGSAIYFASASSLDPSARGPAEIGRSFRFETFDPAVELVARTPLAGETTQLPVAGPATSPAALTRNGRFVTWGPYLVEAATGVKELIGHAAAQPDLPANEEVFCRMASEDGRFVLYDTLSNDVAPVADRNGVSDVYLYDRVAASPYLVSHSASSPLAVGNSDSRASWVSQDGAYVVFESKSSDLVPGFTGSEIYRNLYLYDRSALGAQLLTHAHGSLLAGGQGDSRLVAIAADRLWVVYSSRATNLVPGFGDGNAGADLYFYDRASHQTRLIDHRAGTSNISSGGTPEATRVTADGAAVFYTSFADDLVPDQVLQPATSKVYRWNRTTDSNELVIHQPGDPARPCSGSIALADMSPDGRWLLLWGTCRLVPGDTNTSNDVYLYDRVAATATLISHLPGDPQRSLGVDARAATLSLDRRRVIYSQAGVPYAYELASGTSFPLLIPYFDPQEKPVAATVLAADAAAGRLLLGSSDAGVVPFDPNQRLDVFLVGTGVLFADGFESGATTAWSQTLP